VSGHALAVVVILFWTGISVAVGVHAINRDRSGFLWGGLTFVTGLIGLLVYAVVAGTAAEEVDDDDPERRRRCPACSASHDDAPDYCPDCGEPLDEDDDVVVARLLRSGSRAYCSNCKERVDLDADDCPNCGAGF
jgi:RNA polymerase subunit RPABC4/transcription elongation factor Spt4